MPRQKTDTKQQVDNKRRSRISQTDIPRFSLIESLKIAQSLIDDHAGGPSAPYLVAESLGLSPSSSNFRELTGSSIAYGLTEGGYNADSIALSPLGQRAVAPTFEGDDETALVEAVLRPRIMGAFFEKYNRFKFPSDNIAQNVLAEMGVPRDRTTEVLKVIKDNGEFTGIIRQMKTGLFVATDGCKPANRAVVANLEPEESDYAELVQVSEKADGNGHKNSAEPVKSTNNRVFISHGKNRSITEMVKEILTYAKFEPVVSVDKESLAIPVPEKVFDDMRSCSAGVIHVMSEGELLDEQGNRIPRLNENVLIEIGAAMALFKHNFILLVEKGIPLPSNLQGLYRCEYEGDKLDHEATMKLLKTFHEFSTI